MKYRLSDHLDAEMMAQLEKPAAKERAAKSSIAEAATTSFLTADHADRWGARAIHAAQSLRQNTRAGEKTTGASPLQLRLLRRFLFETDPGRRRSKSPGLATPARRHIFVD